MRYSSFPLPLLISCLLLSIFATGLAKPITSTYPSNSPTNAFVVRNPIIPRSTPLQPHHLSKRVYAGTLPGGWRYAWDEVLSFNHIPSAAKYLEEFYQSIVEELSDGDLEAVLERTVAVRDRTFSLIVQMQDQRLGVPLPVLRDFAIRMLVRTQLGFVTKYRGWIQGPGGVVVDIALELAGPLGGSLLDSAMDMYGN